MGRYIVFESREHRDADNAEVDGVFVGGGEHRREDRAAAAAGDEPKNSAVGLFFRFMELG